MSTRIAMFACICQCLDEAPEGSPAPMCWGPGCGRPMHQYRTRTPSAPAFMRENRG